MWQSGKFDKCITSPNLIANQIISFKVTTTSSGGSQMGLNTQKDKTVRAAAHMKDFSLWTLLTIYNICVVEDKGKHI